MSLGTTGIISAEGDPLGVRGRTIRGYRIGPPVESARSGLLYVGWTATESEVLIQFFDETRAQSAALIREQVASWRKFQNPYFAKLIDFVEEPGAPPFLVLERCRGWLLAERLADGPLPPHEVLRVIRGVATGLRAAHESGQRNLGISEESIFVPRYEGEPIKIVGFGAPTIFAAASHLGWAYLPPEQLASQLDTDHRADIYALGVLLCRCATGQFPIELPKGATAEQMAGVLLLGKRRDPLKWLPPLLEPTAFAIKRATVADRGLRYQSVAEFFVEFKNAVSSSVEFLDPETSDAHAVPQAIASEEESNKTVRVSDAAPNAETAAAPPRPTGELASLPASEPGRAVTAATTNVTTPVSGIPSAVAAPHARTTSPDERSGPRTSTNALADARPAPTPRIDPAEPSFALVGADLLPGQTDPLIGKVVNGLRFERLLGAGGMGAVYLAFNIELRRSRAVKVAFTHKSANAEQRFEQERLVMAALLEGGVKRLIEIHSVGRLPNGQPYLEMEYVAGRTLDAVLAEHKRLPLIRALKIINSLCETLEKAHDLKIVHRDLKTNNIIIETGHAQTHKLRVLDWGIARTFGESKQIVTETGAQAGTPGYMSPQAILGYPLDGLADVFSVAAILFELVTGQSPFAGTDNASMMDRTLHVTPPRVSSLRPEVGEAVSDLCAAGLRTNVDERPTMVEFRTGVVEILNSFEVSAVPSPAHTNLSAPLPRQVPFAKRPTQARLTPEQQEFQDRIPKSTPSGNSIAPVTRQSRRIWVATVVTVVMVLGGIAFIAARRRNITAEPRETPAQIPPIAPMVIPAVAKPTQPTAVLPIATAPSKEPGAESATPLPNPPASAATGANSAPKKRRASDSKAHPPSASTKEAHDGTFIDPFGGNN